MQGHKTPFFQLPTPFVKRNNSSARENSDFVSQTVSALLRSVDLIEELASKPNIINGFQSLPDIRERNSSFWTFVMSISLFTSKCLNARTLALPHSYLAAIISCLNLISSPVTTMLKFFRTIENFSPFTWDFGTGVFRCFQFCVLPFGFSSAPYFQAIIKIVEEPGHLYSYFP